MVHRSLSSKKTVMVGLLASATMISGCATRDKDYVPAPQVNILALRRVEPLPTMKPGSKTEQQALKLFEQLYADYTPEALKEGIPKLYAEDAWFGDPFHVVEGLDDITHYFLVMAEPVVSCTFRIDSIQRSGKDYFSRWTMTLVSKAAEKETIETIGMSHVRFDESGKIIFQQDYWDTSAMFDKLPVVGFWTRLVKERVSKGLEK